MKNNTRAKRRRVAKARKLLLTISLLLVVAFAAVGGTIAWLNDRTEGVTNVFTPSMLDIELKETKSDFKMIPGHTIEKDPTVKVAAGSEDCYVFVQLVEEGVMDQTGFNDRNEAVFETIYSFDALLTYEPAGGWQTDEKLPDGVYYRIVEGDTEKGIELSVLKNNAVQVNADVTKEQMVVISGQSYEHGAVRKPRLKVSAYACQLMKDNNNRFTVEEAWDIAKPNYDAE